jgi:hypothetical protein
VTYLLRLLVEVAAELNRLGARWAVVGGLAVSARSRPRFTQDVDLAVAVADDREAERVLAEMVRSGFEAETILEHAPSGKISAVRLRPREVGGPELFVDLLFYSCAIENEIVALADPVSLAPELSVRVAQRGHLIAMKLLSRDRERRPLDDDDLRVLIEASTAADLELARTAVRQIEARDRAGARTLASDLEEWIARHGR